MAVYKRGNIWWYEFMVDSKLIRQSARTTKKLVAKRKAKEHQRTLHDAHAAEQHAKLIMAQFPIATIQRWLDERRAAERAVKRKR